MCSGLAISRCEYIASHSLPVQWKTVPHQLSGSVTQSGSLSIDGWVGNGGLIGGVSTLLSGEQQPPRRGAGPTRAAPEAQPRLRPVASARNTSWSVTSPTVRDTERAPWPTSVSRRISTGRFAGSELVACCSAAHILRAWLGSTRVSDSKTVNSTDG